MLLTFPHPPVVMYPISSSQSNPANLVFLQLLIRRPISHFHPPCLHLHLRLSAHPTFIGPVADLAASLSGYRYTFTLSSLVEVQWRDTIRPTPPLRFPRKQNAITMLLMTSQTRLYASRLQITLSAPRFMIPRCINRDPTKWRNAS